MNTADLIALGLFPKKRLRLASVCAPIGDSRVDQIHLDHGIFQNLSNANLLPWGNAISGHRITLAGNWGNSGDRSDQMLARLAAAVASKAGTMYVHIGANDIAQSATTFVSTAGPMVGQTINAANVASHVFQNVAYAYAAAINAGFSNFIVVLEPGATNFTAANISSLLELNQRWREWGEVTPGVVVFDLPLYIWDAAASTGSAIAFKSGYMRDSTHLAAPGAYAAGVPFASLLTQLYPPQSWGVRNVFEVPSANAAINQMVNPLFMTTTGGVLGAGITGAMPASWSGSRSGAATCVASTGTPADGTPGKELILAITFTAAGETVSVFQDWTLANWGPNDIAQAGSDIKVDDCTGLAGVQQYLQSNGSGNGFGAVTALDMCPIANTQFITGPLSLTLVTEKLKVPNYTTKSWITQKVLVTAAAAGSVTVRVRRHWGRRRFA